MRARVRTYHKRGGRAGSHGGLTSGAGGPLARARPATPHGIESSGTRKGPPGEESRYI